MKIFSSIIILFFFIQSNVLAQANISGKIQNAQSKEYIDFANIFLLNNDGKTIAKTNSNKEGDFKFENLEPNTYKIKVSYISALPYLSTEIKISGNEKKDIGIIKLLPMKSTEEVVVKGEKNNFELKGDKKVFNVDKSLISNMGTAADVLNQVPSVQVDNDGNVSLRGKSNVTIFIDGKQSQLFGNNPADIISQLPAGSIDKIEVLTNPSSKYDAQGMGGAINIVLKKNDKKGFGGNITLGAGTGKRQNNVLNLNYGKKKHSFGLNFSHVYDNKDTYTSLERQSDIDNIFYHTVAIQDHEKRRIRNFLTLSDEININKNNNLSLSINGALMQVRNNEKNFIMYYSPSQNLDSFLNRNFKLNVNPLSIGTNIAWKHNFNSDKKFITFTYQNSSFFVTRNQDYFTQKYNTSYQQIGVDTLQPAEGSGKNINHTFQADYTTQWLKNITIETGLKEQLTIFNSNGTGYKKYNSESIIDSALTNSFNYNQNLYAGYINAYREVKNITYQLGLRAEGFNYDGLVTGYIPVKITYLNLFPSAFFTYKLNELNSFQFNYSKRVNRPSFFDIFPYRNLSDPLNIRVGNPSLRPEFVHLNEINYNVKSKSGINILASLYSQYTTNLIQRIRIYYPDGSSLLTPYNLNSGWTYGLDFTSIIPLYKNSDWTFNANVFHSQIDGSNVANADASNTGNSWFVKSVANFSFPKSFKIQWTANYLAKAYISQGYNEPRYWTDIAIRKSFLKNKLSATFNANDIFNTMRTVSIYNNPAIPIYQKNDEKPNSHYYQLSLTWNFNNSTNNTKKKKQEQIKDRNNNFNGGNGGGNEE